MSDRKNIEFVVEDDIFFEDLYQILYAGTYIISVPANYETEEISEEDIVYDYNIIIESKT